MGKLSVRLARPWMTGVLVSEVKAGGVLPVTEVPTAQGTGPGAGVQDAPGKC